MCFSVRRRSTQKAEQGLPLLTRATQLRGEGHTDDDRFESDYHQLESPTFRRSHSFGITLFTFTSFMHDLRSTETMTYDCNRNKRMCMYSMGGKERLGKTNSPHIGQQPSFRRVESSIFRIQAVIIFQIGDTCWMISCTPPTTTAAA